MKSSTLILLPVLLLTACNSVSYEPESMTPGVKVYATRGGYGMRRSIKEALEERGYDVIVGRAIKFSEFGEYEHEESNVPKSVKYAIRVSEREEKLWAWWCPFNGFWWWNFSVSIADQDTGQELMTWRGRGCAHSSMRKLEHILDEMEKKDAKQQSTKRNNRMRSGGIMYI